MSFIDEFEADFGGTSLNRPLKVALDLFEGSPKEKGLIFVLTDGQVWDRDEVFNLVDNIPKNVRISTFGIGHYFDEHLVRVLAEKGRGSFSNLYDPTEENLSAATILALNRAMLPSLSECSL